MTTVTRLSKTYQNIQRFIVKRDIFIFFRQVGPGDFETSIKGLKESIDKALQSVSNPKWSKYWPNYNYFL